MGTYLQVPFCLQLPEQQSAPLVHESPLRPQVTVSQVSVASLQVSPDPHGSPLETQFSTGSQLSVPLQNKPSSGQFPSFGVLTQLWLTQSSSVQATPSLQSPGPLQVTTQSIAQLFSSSPESQVPSPQQNEPALKVQSQVSWVQRLSLQSTGLVPPPPPASPLQQ